MLDVNGNYDQQKQLIKINTIVTILDYRFPQLKCGFLYHLSLDELDEIISRIGVITLEELEAYQQKAQKE